MLNVTIGNIELKIVADTSVVIAVITNEQTKTKLIGLTQGYQLYAPSSITWEVGNAISAMYKRKSINEKDGSNILSEYKKMPIALIDIDVLASIKIAHHYSMYAYDAYMVQCAKEQRASLITLDKKLAQIAKQENIKTIEVN